MDKTVLNVLTDQLVKVLNDSLPRISGSWWNDLVFDKLTYQQQSLARQNNLHSLEQLDLAALLRVADQNWPELSLRLNLDKAARNWLKEGMTIRNRLAHAPAEGLPNDLLYRDTDTVERLLQTFGADSATLNNVAQYKKSLLSKLTVDEIRSDEPAAVAATQEIFKPGDIVSFKAEPGKTGAIIAAQKGDPESRYQVFHGGAIFTYYEPNLNRRPKYPCGRPLNQMLCMQR